MGKLGYHFDVVPGITPVNLAAAANTGERLRLRDYGGVAIVFFKAAGGAGEAPTVDVREHNAASSGTSQDLDVVERYFKKEAATLTSAAAWVEVTQSAASEVTDADWDDANEVLVVIEVEATSLSDGFDWISADVPDVGTTAQVGCLLYIPYELAWPSAPQDLLTPV